MLTLLYVSLFVSHTFCDSTFCCPCFLFHPLPQVYSISGGNCTVTGLFQPLYVFQVSDPTRLSYLLVTLGYLLFLSDFIFALSLLSLLELCSDGVLRKDRKKLWAFQWDKNKEKSHCARLSETLPSLMPTFLQRWLTVVDAFLWYSNSDLLKRWGRVQQLF